MSPSIGGNSGNVTEGNASGTLANAQNNNQSAQTPSLVRPSAVFGAKPRL